MTDKRFQVVEYRPVVVASFDDQQEAEAYFESDAYVTSDTNGAERGELRDTNSDQPYVIDFWV